MSAALVACASPTGTDPLDPPVPPVPEGPPPPIAACDLSEGPEQPVGSGCTQRTADDIEGLSPSDLAAYLPEQNPECLYYLWSFAGRVRTVLESDDHVVAVADALASESDPKRAESLLLFLRIRWFQDFYGGESAFAGSDEARVREATARGLAGIAPRLNPYSEEQSVHDALIEFGAAVDAAELGGNHIADFTLQLNAAAEGIATFAETFATWSMLTGVARGIGNRDEALIAAIDEPFVDALLRLAASCPPDWLLDNTLWTIGQVGSIPRFSERARGALTEALDAFPRSSSPYRWALGALDEFLDCLRSDGERICKDSLVDEIEAEVFPNRYEYNGGSLIVLTPLDRETVDELYFAMMEVRSRFFRILERPEPVADDVNDVATFRIYGSLQDYEEYQGWLYRQPTNNGGIYIERNATLYTYQRTPEESIYSLEELVRHEYVHYLIGRYAAAGEWGIHPIYAGNRMAFFDEGLAEFLTWSTRTDGIRTRKILVENVRADESRMNVREILESSYGSFRFYNYAGLFFNMLFEQDLELIQRLMDAAGRGDVEGFDAELAVIRDDANLQARYDAYLDEVLAAEGLEDVYTEVPADPWGADFGAVMNAIESHARISSVTCSAIPGAFTCEGEWVGSVTPGLDYAGAWHQTDEALDALLVELGESGVSNWQAANCSFTNLRTQSTDGGGYPIASVVCEGPLAL